MSNDNPNASLWDTGELGRIIKPAYHGGRRLHLKNVEGGTSSEQTTRFEEHDFHSPQHANRACSMCICFKARNTRSPLALGVAPMYGLVPAGRGRRSSTTAAPSSSSFRASTGTSLHTLSLLHSCSRSKQSANIVSFLELSCQVFHHPNTSCWVWATPTFSLQSCMLGEPLALLSETDHLDFCTSSTRWACCCLSAAGCPCTGTRFAHPAARSKRRLPLVLVRTCGIRHNVQRTLRAVSHHMHAPFSCLGITTSA
jgi:hypothetical protein